MRLLLPFLSLTFLTLLSGCIPSRIVGYLPNGAVISLDYYPGGNVLEDLIIFEGKNLFGTAQYQIDDPLGDVGFRFNSGERVQAECTSIGKNIIGQTECKVYTVYRSSFDAIPQGTVFNRPNMY